LPRHWTRALRSTTDPTHVASLYVVKVASLYVVKVASLYVVKVTSLYVVKIARGEVRLILLTMVVVLAVRCADAT